MANISTAERIEDDVSTATPAFDTPDRWSESERSIQDDKHADHRDIQRRGIRESARSAVEEVRSRDIPEVAEEDEQVDREYASAPERDEVTDSDRDNEVRSKRALSAPTAWDKTAKAEWANTPEKVKAAVTKREKDVAKGVEQLKASIAAQYQQHYGEIDQAIGPWAEVIRQFNKTPGEAVAQLFAWFDALARNPDAAFPALLQSYGYSGWRLMEATGVTNAEVWEIYKWLKSRPRDPRVVEAQRQAAAAQRQAQAEDERRLKQAQADQESRTAAQLNQWAADKKHFADVRFTMGALLTPDARTGMAVIPLNNGKIDLDASYDCALILHGVKEHPAIVARRKTEQEKAAKARRASGSVTSSAPGAEVSRRGSGPQKGMSVRDSLRAAISELSNR